LRPGPSAAKWDSSRAIGGSLLAREQRPLEGIGAGVTVTTTSLPSSTAGLAYAQTLAASGGAPPYSNWMVVPGSGALPAGLSLNASTGAISGTPTTSGTFAFSVTVKDSAGNTAPAQALSITIGTGVTITTTSMPNGTAGLAYAQTLAASGGAPPYSNGR
jgi:large repetitive protein